MRLQEGRTIFPTLPQPSHRAAGGIRQDLVNYKPDLAYHFQFIQLGAEASKYFPDSIKLNNLYKKARLYGHSCCMLHKLRALGQTAAILVKIL